MAESPVSQSSKLSFLQIFRAFAAGIVAVAHMAKEISGNATFAGSATLHHLRSGTFGVDVFFVISGFIMIYTTRRAEGGFGDAAGFLQRRLLRIVPVYWFYTSLFLAVTLLHPAALNHSMTGIAHVIGSYFFVPVPRPEDGVMEPILGLGWTLNYEMYFYGVFALLLLLPRRYLFAALGLYFVSTVLIGVLFDRNALMLWYWTRTNVLEFVFGAVIAEMYLRRVEIKPWLAAIAIGVALAGWQLAYVHYSYGVEDANLRGFVWGVPAAILVGAVALCVQARDILSNGGIAAYLVMIGDSSYSLYLSHMFVVRIVTLLLPVAVFGPFYPVAFIAVALCLCIVVAHFSYIWLERPVAEHGKALLEARGG